MSGVRVETDKLVPERAFYDVQLYSKRGRNSTSIPRRKILEGNSVIARVVWLRLIEIHRCEAHPRYPDNSCTVRRTTGDRA